MWDATTGNYVLDDTVAIDGSTDKLSSIAGAKQLSGDASNLTRRNTYVLAKKRGAGWEQAYAATAAASQLLMLIE